MSLTQDMLLNILLFNLLNFYNLYYFLKTLFAWQSNQRLNIFYPNITYFNKFYYILNLNIINLSKK